MIFSVSGEYDFSKFWQAEMNLEDQGNPTHPPIKQKVDGEINDFALNEIFSPHFNNNAHLFGDSSSTEDLLGVDDWFGGDDNQFDMDLDGGWLIDFPTDSGDQTLSGNQTLLDCFGESNEWFELAEDSDWPAIDNGTNESLNLKGKLKRSREDFEAPSAGVQIIEDTTDAAYKLLFGKK